ncbi:succinyl-diaminopimelate desuccinylase [Enterococcus villorum]|uniref:Probable succinyl-diaminopimelate desuccinylase n=1 Tax=Enterococcus villorum TaxID=112904 RepID=A0A1V8YC92_9ENTE|nr:ArgE/DapE family deacylase [Enterococcus villorum]OQO70233.1 succinyl-diaminopimelate desuccinylase [Enterococcus villorum]OQO76962.1 succinyl-diaminopimelate desuccinylase [Enterococcus villorum]
MEKEEKISILQEIVRINSVNGNEGEVAEYLKQLLNRHGIEGKIVSYSDGRDNLVASFENGYQKKVLGLSGHMDVVSAGDESAWTYPPFAAEIQENRLYGRGTTDMKSGLAAMVIAMIELKESGQTFNGTVKLLATVGEEIGELGSEQLTKEGYVDDLDGLIIGEPTNYNLMYTHMGSINYTVISYGKEAHSSMPQEGYNAINHLNEFITRVNEKMNRIAEEFQNPVLGQPIHNITVISGGNQVNSIPSQARLQGNIRSIPEFSNEKTIALLQKIINELNEGAKYQLELKIDYNKIPVKADPDSHLICCIQEQFEQPLPLVGAAGTTDAAEFTKSSHAFDFVVFGPGVVTLPHQINEYVEIDNYLEMIDKYQAIILSYLA